MYDGCCSLVQMGTCFGKKPFCSCLVYSGAYFKALLLLMMEKLKDKCRDLCHSRGCLGCFTKPKHIISVDEPSKGLKIQGRGADKKPSCLSEDFWSSSTFEMDNNSAAQSQRSVSSITTSNQTLDPQCGPSSSNPPEFVNHGLLLWNKTRQQWVGNKEGSSKRTPVREPRISWNATYESLLGTNKPFPQPVPLSEMVSFLYDVWEQEGLYD